MKRLAVLILATTPVPAKDQTPLRRGRMLAGTLTADPRHTYTVELDDSMYVFGHVRSSMPFAQVEFQRAANGAITGLRVGNGRTKNVRFVRQ